MEKKEILLTKDFEIWQIAGKYEVSQIVYDFGRYVWRYDTIEEAFSKVKQLTGKDYVCKWGKWWETDSSFVD